MKKYKLKKEIKEGLKELLLYLSIFIAMTTSILLIINKIDKDFKKCDSITGTTCNLYDLRDYYHSKKN